MGGNSSRSIANCLKSAAFMILVMGSQAAFAEEPCFIGKLGTSREDIHSIQFNSTSTEILAGSDDGYTKVWDVKDGRVLEKIGKIKNLLAVRLSPDEKFVVTSSERDGVQIWDLNTGAVITELKGSKSPVKVIAISPDGKYIVGGGSDEMLTVWGAQGNEPVCVIPAHNGCVKGLCFSPDGEYLASCGDDGAIRIWQVGTGYLSTTFSCGEPLNDIQYSPCGNYVAVAGRIARIFNARTGVLKMAFDGHQGKINCMAFSPKGNYLITGSEDKSAKIWACCTGRCLATLINQEGPITATTFSPDGCKVATGSAPICCVAAGSGACGEACIALWNVAELSPDKKIAHEVERDLYNWRKRGEFEKERDYQLRMNTTDKKTGEIFAKAFRKYQQEIQEACSISEYDADNEQYCVTIPTIGKIVVKVPLAQAALFKERFSEVVFRDFIVAPETIMPNESSYKLKRVELYIPSCKQSILYNCVE